MQIYLYNQNKSIYKPVFCCFVTDLIIKTEIFAIITLKLSKNIFYCQRLMIQAGINDNKYDNMNPKT